MSAIEIAWGIVSIIVLFLILATVILLSMLIHSKKTRESEEKYRLLFDRVLAPIILINEKCQIAAVNQASCQMLGCEEKELVGVALRDFISKEKWLKFQSEIVKCLANTIDYHGEIALVGKDGRLIQTEIGTTNYKSKDNSFLLASFRDISAHKRAESAYREKNTALNQVLAHLEEEKLKYKKQIAETIDQALAPILGKLVREDGTISKDHLNSLQDGLAEMAAQAGGMEHAYGKLTPREIEICNLLKGGATSKDVAKALDISILTVNKHRERIRKKLVLVKKDVNLSTYLRRN
jgi:PAS domain S-box-containing protein